MDYYKIGQKIRKYRKAHGFSQEELAERVNISTTHMSHIETGNTKLSLNVFADIAAVLDVRADALLDNETAIAADHYEEIAAVLEHCTVREAQIITDVVKATKLALDKHK